ncbi:MAG TPA: thioredoxin family protein [Melioribacteraceae bacterium]|nr:thioredoxin family protein [Melioribacteraceae bacterium]
MKKTFLFLILFGMVITAQEKNKLISDQRSGKTILIGFCDRKAFADTNFAWWYDSEYQNYEIDKGVVDSINSKLDNLSITIVMATWCSDSRREVPRFFRILDELNYDTDNLKMICVDRKKESPEGNVQSMDIKFVPTFIFNRGGTEIGRIIETPKISLERDLKEIVYR